MRVDRETPDFAAIFAALEGSWELTRTTCDGALFTGIAHFDCIGERSLALHESGTLRLGNGTQLAAGRRWHWDFRPPGTVEIHFADLRSGLYHRLDIAAGDAEWEASATHLCGDDRYTADYRFTIGRIDIVHRIAGPMKNSRIRAEYRRMSGIEHVCRAPAFVLGD